MDDLFKIIEGLIDNKLPKEKVLVVPKKKKHSGVEPAQRCYQKS